MKSESEAGLNFSQRNGLLPLPPQLKLGELDQRSRNLLWNAVYVRLEGCISYTYSSGWLDGDWAKIARDFSVRMLNAAPDTYNSDLQSNINMLKGVISRSPFNHVFDAIEFLLRHPLADQGLRTGLAEALVEGRAAYRIFDGKSVTPVGTAEQGDAIGGALQAAGRLGATGAAKHLLDSGSRLRDGDWAGSVRESIHAVESVSVLLAAPKDTLGAALAQLGNAGHVHGSLKSAFSSLYGYASDEEGVRHSLVFNDEAAVDETDAIFMLGACASFVSYLLARGNAAGLINQQRA